MRCGGSQRGREENAYQECCLIEGLNSLQDSKTSHTLVKTVVMMYGAETWQ